METAVVMGMVFLVNLLLLSAAAVLRRGKCQWKRSVVGAHLGAVYALASLLPGAWWLHSWGIYLLSLLAVGLVTYGFSRQNWLQSLLFVLLQLSVGRVTGLHKGMVSMLIGAVGITLASLLIQTRTLLQPVEITYRGKTLRLTALCDTGNNLRDPITGRSALVISGETAQQLTGLTRQQLADPVSQLPKLPGARLIPYHTVGNSGFLLALQIPDVKIGAWRGSTLVALSPQRFESSYQALTGGFL